ncbi:RAMP superfamily CRISPR-associated protein [Campylobacter geochelonis]|uniref:CRISPR-associated RAMP protein n=1 Tax=Campylobacter geochelonis TaxID=1780362 RepID=A0A128EBE3_9BACT|nr:RAMP superfamily CRISPR-associated protein [Campylobacter geochelonis]QKF72049.1 CRISPR/Cas system-associated RAMP protein Csm3, type III (SSO1426 family; dual Csm3 domains) [Campylobacter geochelonis]CZE45797.1 CRISPR-associated RAMP protein [Campylobacter geochelonis]CZE46835.1 CRISPR-associated RAMP protein [Campylobacter geochelonis]CZE49864.1 CRISPR-associated RAMP protein [Campylobacter geochelonis]
MSNRYIANIVFEAKTPIKVGSSSVDMLQDSPFQRDFNGLPMILGSSLAGVLRRSLSFLGDEIIKDIFGNDEEKLTGSKLIISNALLCDEKMQVNEKLLLEKSEFLKCFSSLPIRDHVAITDKGVAKENSKFDEEVVFKGSRFKFRFELISDNDKIWQEILQALCEKSLRIGGGSAKGFGEIEVLKDYSTWDKFKLTSKEYQDKSSSLNTEFSTKFSIKNSVKKEFVSYKLKLTPDDFFMFGSGFGDDTCDNKNIYEKVVEYRNNSAKFSDEMVLIPASSIKGAIAHRAVFYYNKLDCKFAGNDSAITSLDEIFGTKKERNDSKKNDKKTEKGEKGKVLFSDVFLEKKSEKVINHVAIDRFTGGAIEGALFQERVVAKQPEFCINLLLNSKGIDEKTINAFEMALDDICKGMLPLGGMTTKGHGFFKGYIEKNGEKYEVPRPKQDC